MNKKLLMIAAILGGLAVAIGAYGAHGGAKYMTDETVITFGKAVRYQMYHALAILAIAIAYIQMPKQQKLLNLAGYAMFTGVLLFSGSLYIIVFAKLKMGYITPTGGVLMVLGWFSLAYAALKHKE